MDRRSRIAAFSVLAACLVAGTTVYVGFDPGRADESTPQSPDVETATLQALEAEPHVVFRNTKVGDDYGRVSMVALADPDGPRAFADITCDRIYAAADTVSCLRTKRGLATDFEAEQFDSRWKPKRMWRLPGTPSRTRVSADGSLIATTAFEARHAYAQVGFSTETVIRAASGRDFGNLEKFTLINAGHEVDAVDRNIWGVTFARDDNTFYATAATGGQMYLVRGDLRARTLTTIHEGVECPSLSPDGKSVAYKKNLGTTSAHWSIAVLDLASGQETVLAGEVRSVDDQVEWLDQTTVLYGMPRRNEAGVNDVWSIATVEEAKPQIFITHAWSPSVVRS